MPAYIGLRILIFLFSLVPMSLLYLKADSIAWILRVLGYRKSVIDDSLNRVFHDKDPRWKARIRRRFYRNLADISLEALKGFSLVQKKLESRYLVENPELLNDICDEGKSVIVVAGHYGNWEWSPRALTSQLKHKIVGLYKPLKNKYTDAYIRKVRAAHGAELRSIKNTSQIFKDNEGIPAVYLMAADQSPSNVKAAYRMTFLGQDCLVLHGPEYYARKYNMPVVFGAVHREGRGRYRIVFEKLGEDYDKLPDGAITLDYMRRLEEIIYEKPEDWLWSHARWKRDPIKHCPEKKAIDEG